MHDLTTLIAAATPQAAHGDVSPAVTAFFGGLLVLMILCLAFEEKIHAKKSIITGVFAAISLLCATAAGLLPFGPVVNVFHESIRLPIYIPAVDWGVIAIIVALAFVPMVLATGAAVDFARSFIVKARL
ncbi:hypothetical protein CMK11_12850, partial [Candidatus Poribacteria bacterium]|nr:hypothetical protein [Candidatus Poribacteria bacterium]